MPIITKKITSLISFFKEIQNEGIEGPYQSAISLLNPELYVSIDILVGHISLSADTQERILDKTIKTINEISRRINDVLLDPNDENIYGFSTEHLENQYKSKIEFKNNKGIDMVLFYNSYNDLFSGTNKERLDGEIKEYPLNCTLLNYISDIANLKELNMIRKLKAHGNSLILTKETALEYFDFS